MLLRGLLLSVLLVLTLPVLAQDAAPSPPYLVPTDCAFPQSWRDVAYECGYLVVPEDRSADNDRVVRIHYAVQRAQSANPAPDPVVFLDGGPGSATLARISGTEQFDMLNTERDLVFFDQRGVGSSRPSLNCAELTTLRAQILDENYSTREVYKRELAAIEECRARLIGNDVNLAAFNTTANAADVADLMRLLGYRTWNLYGISYGTQLGLTLLRDFPQVVRSAVLMSVAPTDVNWVQDIPQHVDRALNLFFAACEDDVICRNAYPRLQDRFYTLIAELNANPVTVNTETIFGGLTRVVVRGDHYLEYAFSSLYSSWGIADLPRVIFAGLNDDHEEIAAWRYAITLSEINFSSGMHYSVVCADTLSFSSYEDMAGADRAYPRQLDALDQRYFTDICALWDVPGSPAAQGEAVRSDVPTLVLAGDFDPITPPTYADRALSGLSKAQYRLLPYQGHDMSDDPCTQSIIQAFVENPFDNPERDNCVAETARGFSFRLP